MRFLWELENTMILRKIEILMVQNQREFFYYHEDEGIREWSWYRIRDFVKNMYGQDSFSEV